MNPITRAGGMPVAFTEHIDPQIEEMYMLHWTKDLTFDTAALNANRGRKEICVGGLDDQNRLLSLKEISSHLIDLMVKWGPDAKMSLVTQQVYVDVDESDLEVLAKLRYQEWIKYKTTPDFRKDLLAYRDSLFVPYDPTKPAEVPEFPETELEL